MARYLYICAPGDPVADPGGEAEQARATFLGCGWMPAVPPAFADSAISPCVIVSGAGATTVLPDDGTLQPNAVAAAAAPILAAEAAATTAQAVISTNQQTLQAKVQAAIATNQAYLAIGSPTAAQIATQTASLTRQMTALLRLVSGQLSTTAGT